MNELPKYYINANNGFCIYGNNLYWIDYERRKPCISHKTPLVLGHSGIKYSMRFMSSYMLQVF